MYRAFSDGKGGKNIGLLKPCILYNYIYCIVNNQFHDCALVLVYSQSESQSGIYITFSNIGPMLAIKGYLLTFAHISSNQIRIVIFAVYSSCPRAPSFYQSVKALCHVLHR
jgi:hypothetical protein